MRISLVRTAIILAAGMLAAPAFCQSPAISGFVPSSVQAGGPSFTLTIQGANFTAGAVAYWNGAALTTAFGGTTQLIATIPASYIGSPGAPVITVINPGGVQSSPAFFLITGSPLAIATTSLPVASAGAPYSVALSANGGSPPYVWSASGLPGGLTITPGGTISGAATAASSFPVRVTVTDSARASATTLLTLVVATPSFSITTASLPQATAGQPYSITLTATGGTPPYQWGATSALPTGLTLSPLTGVLSGTPVAPGSFTLSINVTDSSQSIAARQLLLTVTAQTLSITTTAPLFNGIAGAPYSQPFTAQGGTPPYQWTIASGSAGGLTLDAVSGTLQGTPSAAGTFNFTVQVSDSASHSASQAFSLTVTPPQLVITTGATLPSGVVGTAYTQKFSAVNGSAPFQWSFSGAAIPGLVFDSASGTLSGSPLAAGIFTFSLTATDSSSRTATKAFSLTITAGALTIVTPLQLPDTPVGSLFTQTISAVGGVPPYTWSANGLPAGLALNASTGTISGTLAAAGSLAFTVRVTDSALNSVVALFHLTAALPTPPTVTIAGISGTIAPATQPQLQIALGGPYLEPITGQALLTFTPDTGPGDSTIQFSTGGRTAAFTIPAGSTQAVFTGSPLTFQSGTVAGTVTVSLSLQSAGLDITPSPAPSLTARVQAAAPVITSTQVVATSNGFNIVVNGYSTTLDMQQAQFSFTAAAGSTLATQTVNLSVQNVFNDWYQNSSALTYGSLFSMTAPFTIQGSASAVIPQSVTLTNRIGSTTATIQR